MTKHKGEKFLVPLSSVHSDKIASLLDDKKLNHTECVMYRTVSNDFTDDEKKNFDYDMVVFFSPTGVKALKENFPNLVQGDIRIAAFGPATAKTVIDEGFRLDLQAPSADHPSMTSALNAYLKKENKKK
jgi:uroporphyrinogen-III synthase